MSSVKTLNEWGVLAKDEVTYGTFLAPAVTDGILCSELPEPSFDYIHDGGRGISPTGGFLSGVGRSGRGGALAAVSQMILPGAAYSASVFPNLDRWLRYCGFASTVVTTPSSESYTFDPEASGFDSGSLRVYREGQQFDIAGAYGTFSIAADGPEVPVWSFEFQGIMNALPVIMALPAITYINGTKEPPKSENVSLTIGAYTAGVLKSWEFTLNRELSRRVNDNATESHAGYTPGNRDPRLMLVIEADLLATFDPYTLAENQTAQAVSLQIGATQYSKWKLSLPTAEIVNVSEGAEGATAMWELEIQGKVSAPALQNDVQFVMD